MSECTHDCSTCGEACGERTEPQSFLKSHNPSARVGKVYGIVSGKGGVGKSMVTSQLAVLAQRSRRVSWTPTSPAPPSPRPLASTSGPWGMSGGCCR